MNFKMIAAAAAFLAAGAANAAITSFDGGTVAGNGSVVLLKADTTGTVTQGLTVDLGFNYLDFANNGALAQAGTTIVWDFSANTITKNGALVTGVTNDWASQFAIFAANSDAAETKWAIASGSQKGTTVTGFLASGNPTAAQFTSQASGNTANMGQITAPLIGAPGTTAGNANKGTFASADNGAFAMGSTDSSYVGTAYSLTSVNGWKNNIKWNTWLADGDTSAFTQLNANGSESLIANASFKLVGNTLTYTVAGAVTPSVPEPESFVLALAGVFGLALARRRAAK